MQRGMVLLVMKHDSFVIMGLQNHFATGVLQPIDSWKNFARMSTCSFCFA